jgi:formylglycine-generating enzyme required for sulfatase activity
MRLIRFKPAPLFLFLGFALLAAVASRLVAAAEPTAGRDGSAIAASEEVFVPAGQFSMGCAPDYFIGVCDPDVKPIHTVQVDAFYIDRTEVTNAQYRACVTAGACLPPLANASSTRQDYYTNPLYNNYPVIHVNWYRANAYCQWIGRRLPTEAEWEKAARGTDLRWFPWGNDAPTCERLNYGPCGGDTVAVGSHPAGASPYGALDMAGNVSEWVNDLYESRYYYTSPYYNPQGPASTGANEHLARGGSWAADIRHMTTYVRLDGADIYSEGEIGFRCARSAPGPTPTATPAPVPSAASAIGPDGGALWMPYSRQLDLLIVPPGAVSASTAFTLTYDSRSNAQEDLQGIGQFFYLQAASPASLTAPVRLFLGFDGYRGVISNTMTLYRLGPTTWLTDGITVTERTGGYLVAEVDQTGVYGLMGRTNRFYLPIVLRGD